LRGGMICILFCRGDEKVIYLEKDGNKAKMRVTNKKRYFEKEGMKGQKNNIFV
jgi:hypothetical protein